MKSHLPGFTMIELLISMVLGLSMIAGIGSLFTSFQRTSQVQRSLSYMLEDGRYILETMGKELRNTGFLRNPVVVKSRTTLAGTPPNPNSAGFLRNANNLSSALTAEYCDSRVDESCPVFLQDPNPVCATTSTACTGVLGSANPGIINFGAPVLNSVGNFMEAVKGDDGDPTSTVPATSSDSFAIRYQLNDQYDLMAATNATGTESSNSPCTQNIRLTMQNGSGGNGWVDENPAAQPITTTPTGNLGAQVNVVTIYFYVANDSNGIPTLYCRAKRENQIAGNLGPQGAASANGITSTIYNVMNPGVSSTPAAQFLISDIYTMVVKYGVEEDLNNTPADRTDDSFYYSDANNVTDWTRVIAVKLFFVLRSTDDNIAKNAPTFSIDGVACSAINNIPFPCPTDKRLYRVFSTTVSFRNAMAY